VYECVLEVTDFSGDHSPVEDVGCSVTVINAWTHTHTHTHTIYR